MDEARETKHSRRAAAIVVLVALVLSYSGGYACYRSKSVRVKRMQTCGPFCKGELVLTPAPSCRSPLGKVLCGLFYPAFLTEARFRRMTSSRGDWVCKSSLKRPGCALHYLDSEPNQEITPEPTEPDEAASLDAED